MEAITYILLCAVLIIVMYNGLYSVTGGFSNTGGTIAHIRRLFCITRSCINFMVIISSMVFTYEVFNPLMIIALVLTGYDLYAKRDSWGCIKLLGCTSWISRFVHGLLVMMTYEKNKIAEGQHHILLESSD